MGSEMWAAIVGAVLGAVVGGAVAYVVARVQRPGERAEQLLRDKMKERWAIAMELKHGLSEMRHGFGHIRSGNIAYVELGRVHRKRVREQARKAEPLLGTIVNEGIHELTDAYEAVYATVGPGTPPAVDLVDRIGAMDAGVRAAIDEELSSPIPR
jgi:hypothetical protein